MPEKKPTPISSIPCDEGGKRHIKGCPHGMMKAAELAKESVGYTWNKAFKIKEPFTTTPTPANESVTVGWPLGPSTNGSSSTWTAGTPDRNTWTDKDWMLYHMDFQKGMNNKLAFQRNFLVLVLVVIDVLAIISIVS